MAAPLRRNMAPSATLWFASGLALKLLVWFNDDSLWNKIHSQYLSVGSKSLLFLGFTGFVDKRKNIDYQQAYPLEMNLIIHVIFHTYSML